MGLFGGFAGVAAGAAVDSYRKQNEANINNALKQQEYDKNQVAIQRQQAIAADSQKLPAIGSSTTLEYTMPDGSTVKGDQGLTDLIKSKTAGIDPSDTDKINRIAAATMKDAVPTKISPQYTPVDRARDLANVAMQHGDYDTAAKLSASLPALRESQLNADNSEQINKMGADYKANNDEWNKASEEASKGDYSRMNGLAIKMHGQWNSDPAHNNGTKMKVMTNDVGRPTVQVTNAGGDVVNVGELQDDHFLHANTSMYQNNIQSVDPHFLWQGQEVQNHSLTAQAQKQNADTETSLAGSKAAANFAGARHAGAAADEITATTPGKVRLLGAQADMDEGRRAYLYNRANAQGKQGRTFAPLGTNGDVQDDQGQIYNRDDQGNYIPAQIDDSLSGLVGKVRRSRAGPSGGGDSTTQSALSITDPRQAPTTPLPSQRSVDPNPAADYDATYGQR